MSPFARTLVAFGETAVSYVANLLDHADADTRFYATLVAAELPHPELVEPLGRRIFDGDSGVATLSLDVLRLHAGFRAPMHELLELLRSASKVPRYGTARRIRAVVALGELRDEGAISGLIRLLDADERPLLEAAGNTLRLLARQDYGTSKRKWEAWAKKHLAQHRIEWLIEALVHSDEELRREAGAELQQLTQAYFGFHPSQSKREREVIRRKYLEWWEDEGFMRFASS